MGAYDGKTGEELETELKKRGLPHSGTNDEKTARLEESDKDKSSGGSKSGGKSSKGDDSPLNDREPETEQEHLEAAQTGDFVEMAEGSGHPIYKSEDLMDPSRPYNAENPVRRALVSADRDEDFQDAAEAAADRDEN